MPEKQRKSPAVSLTRAARNIRNVRYSKCIYFHIYFRSFSSPAIVYDPRCTRDPSKSAATPDHRASEHPEAALGWDASENRPDFGISREISILSGNFFFPKIPDRKTSPPEGREAPRPFPDRTAPSAQKSIFFGHFVGKPPARVGGGIFFFRAPPDSEFAAAQQGDGILMNILTGS